MPLERRPRLQLREAAREARVHAQQARQYAETCGGRGGWREAVAIISDYLERS